MKKTFAGYYRPTKKEFFELWDGCLFVLDANVLLGLYRYTEETKNDLIGILKKIANRLWIPHQAALEYQRERMVVIVEQEDAYDKTQKLLHKTQARLEKELSFLQRHPLIQTTKLLGNIGETFSKIEKELNKCKDEHPNLLQDDSVRDAITVLLEGKVGRPYSSEKLNEIYKEGKRRYENKIPPGYLDETKGDMRKYGDLVLWFQTIEMAQKRKIPVILVTDDRKKDWWLHFKGKTIGPRPELVEEILSKTGMRFYMYQPAAFMQYAKEQLKQEVREQSIDEIRDVRLHDEKRVKTLQMLNMVSDDVASMRAILKQWPASNDMARQLENQAMVAREYIIRGLKSQAERGYCLEVSTLIDMAPRKLPPSIIREGLYKMEEEGILDFGDDDLYDRDTVVHLKRQD